MENETTTQNDVQEEVVVTDKPVAVASVGTDQSKFKRRPAGSVAGRPDRRPRKDVKVKPEFDQRILDIRRVTRVAAGGRRFSFSVALVVGNKKGMVGVATGKASDTALAIEKAYKAAKKKAIHVNLTKHLSIPHEVYSKFKSARVEIMPAKGRGVVSGSAVRDVVELAGIRDVNSKLRSPTKNKLNIARATIKALSTLKKVK